MCSSEEQEEHWKHSFNESYQSIVWLLRYFMRRHRAKEDDAETAEEEEEGPEN